MESSLKSRDRLFGETFDIELENTIRKESQESNQFPLDAASQELIDFIAKDEVGCQQMFIAPWGDRKILYCDYTASGRALGCIEKFMNEEVLPFYGNTHSSVTVTAEQSTLFLHEARDTIRNALHLNEHDCVLFVGSGTTCAVNVLCHALQPKSPPTVVVSQHEHHSNLLPWKRIARKVITVKAHASSGKIDESDLIKVLQEFANENIDASELYACFGACSNVTGILEEADRISCIVHQFGGFVFWDYASCAPYVNMNMHPLPSEQLDPSKDAMYFSGHKFIGGVQSPGVLVAKKSLFRNDQPLKTGGGTVFFVRSEEHRYLKNIEYREEGGTPDILGSIRLALAMQLKLSVGIEAIKNREAAIIRYVEEAWRNIPNLHVLGPRNPEEKISIYSLVISHPGSGLMLHHNFVCCLLDDLFGIQTRAGCLCAGPYVQYLLGINEELAKRLEESIAEDDRLDRDHLRRDKEYSAYEMLRPGVVRLSLPYFMTMQHIEFVVQSVVFVCEHGWKFLPQYLLNPESGEWHHKDQPVFRDRKWLGRALFTSQGLQFKAKKAKGTKKLSNEQMIQVALQLADKCVQNSSRMDLPDQQLLFDANAAELRWFLLASEAAQLMNTTRTTNHFPKQILNLKCQRLSAASNESTEQLSTQTSNSSSRADFLRKISSTNPMEREASTKLLIQTVCALKRNKKAQGCETQTWSDRKVVCAELDLNAPLRFSWHIPPSSVFKLIIESIEEYKMIQNGDRVLVCLSGGKDSLSLLHSLRQYKFKAQSGGVNFELGAVTVDPGSAAYDPSPLIDYLQGLNLPYFYEQQRILDQAMSLEGLASICSFCSRMKRGRIYAAARNHKYNVLAFGQHIDDLAESLLMNMFHGGRLRTMKAHYTVKEGDLRVIRPLVYVREKCLRQFAEQCKLPVIPENCPACFEAPKERHRTKQLLAAQEVLFPNLFNSLGSSIRRLLKQQYNENDSTCDIEHSQA